MTDISRIPPGPASPHKPGVDKDKAAAAEQKFKEMMQVDKIDPEEQKKGKRREESEEEQVAEMMTEAEAETTKRVEPPKTEQPFRVGAREAGGKVGPLGAPKEAAGPSTPAPQYAPSEERIAPSRRERAPAPTERAQKPSEAPSEAEKPPEVEKKKKKEAAPVPEIKPPAMEEIPEEEGVPFEAEEEIHKKPAPGVPAPTFLEEEEEIVPEKAPFIEEEKIEEEEVFTELPPPPAPGAIQTPKTEKEERKKVIAEAAGVEMGIPTTTQQPQPQPQVPTVAPVASTPYSTLPPDVMRLFDSLVATMTVMNIRGDKETTITLTSEKPGWVFNGCQITIKEYSTAPRAYNIQLTGTPQAVALMTENQDNLLAAFSGGNYNFRVNRLETVISTERPVFRRKEKPGGKSTEQESGGLR